MGSSYHKMTDEKIKIVDNKIQQSKDPYDLDRQTTNISALLSGNVGEYEFLTGEDVLPEKGLLEKVAAIKNWKKQTDIAEKQYQGLDMVYEFDKMESDETIKIIEKQHL